jgi:hypothetical protein
MNHLEAITNRMEDIALQSEITEATASEYSRLAEQRRYFLKEHLIQEEEYLAAKIDAGRYIWSEVCRNR